MASVAVAARKTTLKTAATTTTVAIAEVTRVSANVQGKEAEVTNLASTTLEEEYVPTSVGTLIDLGLNFVPYSTGHEQVVLDKIKIGTTAYFDIAWSDSSTTTWQFTGFWMSINPVAERDQALVADAQIRATGTINWSLP